MPTPTPTAGPVGGTLSGVLDEGDSISVFWPGNHTGIWAAAHPTVPFYGRAIGGSGLEDVLARYDADVVFKPQVVTLLIGANGVSSIGYDWYGWKSPQAYADGIFAWAAKWRATGAKVYVGTVLAQCQAGNPNNSNTTNNSNRAPINTAIRAGVGTKIDGVIDYAADPIIGTDAAACDTALFSDGVHPTVDGQAKMALLYGAVVDRAIQ
jgi:lysophospholipase L1-like esterase